MKASFVVSLLLSLGVSATPAVDTTTIEDGGFTYTGIDKPLLALRGLEARCDCFPCYSPHADCSPGKCQCAGDYGCWSCGGGRMQCQPGPGSGHGYANSNYYGHQIRHLQDGLYTLITIDSRAQGRSGDDPSRSLTYDLMTEDVVALMDYLKIDKFSTVGWSDGGCISFDLAMNFTSRIDRIFSFGGTYSPQNINATIDDSPVWSAYMKRVAKEMWATEPVWDATSFARIPSRYDDDEAPMIWIVDGDSEEAVTRDTPGTLRSWIWGSDLVILPGVSHFAFLQDHGTSNAMLE
ncbi:hypothetical protein FCULG_00007199 [Fusarium culmorum]|uniref:AB hydrolase-1 domain-containing protein n=1 Tax=Fusarium culmorum TaxID=5516 RepID=A0A2T4GVR2_FUSCU|nr:hypothetical protein FCULG_00007199 [Fusarium culmorum]